MEQHPVPQNVTTFQFRLIGDMTIKQFGYLAGGAILAYVSYKLPLPFFFTWPLTIIFALGGVGFAFVPVEERPMDIWVLSFIRSVYSPTQYVWTHQASTAVSTSTSPTKKAAVPILFPQLAALLRPRAVRPSSQPLPPQKPVTSTQPTQDNRTAAVLHSVFTPSAVPVPQQPLPNRTTIPATPSPAHAQQPGTPQRTIVGAGFQNPLVWIMNLFSPLPTQTAPRAIPVGNFPMPSVTGKRIDISPPPIVRPAAKAPQEAMSEVRQKESALEQKLVTLKKDLENKSMTEARVLELQKQLTEVLSQKEKMENELVSLRRQVAAPPPPAVVPARTSAQPSTPSATQSRVAVPQPPPTRSGPTVKIITPESAVKVGLPRLTTFPNVVTGIIKDSENNFLPGVLVTVKDKEGIPLRALKTNRLGQFAASTPLANGVYFVEIEDPRLRFTFDRVQITLNGSIVPAIEIIAKSQKQVNREKLEKEIFGHPTP